MEENQKQRKIKVRLVYGGRGKPDPTQNLEDGLLDWDAHIENPPKPYRSGTIKATFRCVGRSKPIPLSYNELFS